MKRKFAIILLSLALMATVIPMSVGAAVPEGYTAINTAKDLVAVMSDTSKWKGNYFLTADIDLSNEVTTCIGDATIPFSGIFDGNGHTIKGLNIFGASAQGLFGKTLDTTIKNLTLEGTVETLGNAAGGFIGWSTGNFLIENCVNKVVVKSGGDRAGGFIGALDLNISACEATIRNCVNYADITATGQQAGGIAGRPNFYSAEGAILVCENSFNYGNINAKFMAAGIFGRIETGSGGDTGSSTIKGCANYGSVTNTTPEPTLTAAYLGGIVGTVTSRGPVKIENCYNNASITGVGNYVGGIVGFFRSYTNNMASIENCLNNGTLTSNLGYVGGVIGSGNGADFIYTLKNNVSNGNIVVTSTPAYLGGMMGANSKATYDAGTVTNCYYTNTMTLTAEDNMYAVGTFVANKAVAASFPGLDFTNIWVISASYKAPMLRTFATSDDIPGTTPAVTTAAPSATTSTTSPSTGSPVIIMAAAALVSLAAAAAIVKKKVRS